MHQSKNYVVARNHYQNKKNKMGTSSVSVVVRTLAMLPDPAIPRAEIRFNNSDGSFSSSMVLLAADVVFV